MRQFELDDLTRCTISGVNFRSELHGEEHVPAVDVGLKLTMSNDILSQFDGSLKGMLYGKADKATRAAQAELEGVEPTSDMPKLRSSVIEQPIRLACEYVGYKLTIDRGLGGPSNIVLDGCTVKKFKADCKEGGSVELSFQTQAANVDEATSGKLAMLIGAEVAVMLEAPEEQASVGE